MFLETAPDEEPACQHRLAVSLEAEAGEAASRKKKLRARDSAIRGRGVAHRTVRQSARSFPESTSLVGRVSARPVDVVRACLSGTG
jgi:hypothetical protein